MYLGAPSGYSLEQQLLYGSMGERTMRAMFLFPPFHASGVIGMVMFPLQLGVTPFYPPTWTTPAEGVESALVALDTIAMRDQGEAVDCVTLVPPCLEYLGKRPDTLRRLSQRTRQVGWGGGSVSRAASELVAAQVSVLNVMASTELGIWPSIRRSDSDLSQTAYWEYTTFHPALNIHFDPVSSSTEGVTLYEAVMIRNNGTEHDGYIQPIFSIFPEAKERRLGDLFTQHPQNPELWKHYGRADDLLVFLTNEKFFPTAAEQRIASHAGVVEVAMVGTRRPRASLLVRLEDGVSVSDIWDVVEDVNKDSPVYARVGRDKILVVREPFPKTAKGTVQKKALLDLYEKKLDALYEY
jgi:acyl-coenzyme A synthetase/AMP-(fatty) acid ligase